ncbi:hypothetical protein Nmel_014686 [Mimus melanotis]
MGPQQRCARKTCPAEKVLHWGTGQELWARAAQEFRVCAAGLRFTGLKASFPEFQQNENKGKIQIMGDNFCILKKIIRSVRRFSRIWKCVYSQKRECSSAQVR